MTTPAVLIAAAVESACDVANVKAYRPGQLAARTAFVTPADPWKERDDRIGGFEVGLEVYLISAMTDQEQNLAWLDAQSTILLDLDPIDVGDDEVRADAVGAPFVFETADGAKFLACAVTYTKYASPC